MKHYLLLLLASLAMLTGRDVPREVLAGAILRALDRMYRDLLADDLDA